MKTQVLFGPVLLVLLVNLPCCQSGLLISLTMKRCDTYEKLFGNSSSLLKQLEGFGFGLHSSDAMGKLRAKLLLTRVKNWKNRPGSLMKMKPSMSLLAIMSGKSAKQVKDWWETINKAYEKLTHLDRIHEDPYYKSWGCDGASEHFNVKNVAADKIAEKDNLAKEAVERVRAIYRAKRLKTSHKAKKKYFKIIANIGKKLNKRPSLTDATFAGMVAEHLAWDSLLVCFTNQNLKLFKEECEQETQNA